MDNPQVVKFANEGVRVAADKLAAAYRAARSLVESYDATGMAALLGDDSEFKDRIADGSETDGRPPITAGGVILFVENVRAFVKQVEDTKTVTGLSLIQGVHSVSPQYRG